MVALIVVLVTALVAGAVAAATVRAGHGRFEPIDPEAEIRWVVRRLRRHPRALDWVRRRLDRSTATGFVLTASLGTIVVAAASIGALLNMISRRALFARADASVAEWGADNVGVGDIDLLVPITDLGSTNVAVAITAVVVAVALVRRRWSTAGFLVAVVAGQFLLNNVIKLIVGRERPDVARLVGVSGASFPSGHTCAAAATWSALALVASAGSSRWGRAWAAAVAAAVAGAVGATRALLGAHWLTDVLGGLVIGWGWFTLVAVIFGGRRQRAANTLERAAQAEMPATPRSHAQDAAAT